MKKLWEFFEPRNKKEFFGILANYENQGYTVGIGEKGTQLFVFKDKQFIVMLVKRKQFGEYDWVQGAWFVNVITHAAKYDTEENWHLIEPLKTLTIPYPQENVRRINVDLYDAELFYSFIREYVTLTEDKRLKLNRRAKMLKKKNKIRGLTL